MKNIIKEYIELTEGEKKKLWSEATFIFDANIFLKLYEFTDEARNAFFDSLAKIKDRIWIPHQFAYEFMKNRNKKIIDTNKSYDNLNYEIENFIEKMANVFNIKVSNDECNKHKQSLQKWTEVHKKNNLLVKESSDDKILEKILKYFDKKCGEEYNEKDMEKLRQEGETRYKKLIPPGYKDANKEKGQNENNMYGDFIAWKQILDFSKLNNKNIILITNDKKEDWWEIIDGKTIGPRIELKKEFITNTNCKLHMYTLDNFLRYSTENIDAKILEEVKNDIEKSKLKENNFYDERYYLDYKIRSLRDTLRSKMKEIDYIRKKVRDYQDLLYMSKDPIYQLKIQEEMNELRFKENESNFIRDEIRSLLKQIDEINNNVQN